MAPTPAATSSDPARKGSTSPLRALARPITRILPLALGLAAALSIPQAAAPATVQAACGTSWDSRVVPPPSVRVYRTASGRVDVVDFKEYVAVVMASGEWPGSLPQAALEAGAVAVKQFAWYYALDGNHRDSYRTGSGACFDVRDDTNDQLYRPERTEPTPRQRAAVESTWGLSLRKHGRFFLTGYRMGSSGRCASDSDGWKLYERSVRDCAERLGWDRQRIQEAYLSPGLTEVWAPGTGGPVTAAPRLREDGGTTFPAESGRVSWPRAKSDVDVARYRLQRRINGGDWKDVPLSTPLATSARVPLWADRTHQFRVQARDVEGDVGSWATGPVVTARLREPGAAQLASSDWTTVDTAGAIDGTAFISATAGERLTFRFTGRSVGYLATMGPGRGRARILVNGHEVALVDLHAETERTRQLVWARNWDRSRERTVTIEVADADAPVEVDAFLLLR